MECNSKYMEIYLINFNFEDARANCQITNFIFPCQLVQLLGYYSKYFYSCQMCFRANAIVSCDLVLLFLCVHYTSLNKALT